MNKWLVKHPKAAAWIVFPLAPFVMVLAALRDIKEHWQWVSSALEDFRRDSADSFKHSAKQLVGFYKNYPEALMENLDMIEQGDSYAKPPKAKSKGPSN